MCLIYSQNVTDEVRQMLKEGSCTVIKQYLVQEKETGKKCLFSSVLEIEANPTDDGIIHSNWGVGGDSFKKGSSVIHGIHTYVSPKGDEELRIYRDFGEHNFKVNVDIDDLIAANRLSDGKIQAVFKKIQLQMSQEELTKFLENAEYREYEDDEDYCLACGSCSCYGECEDDDICSFCGDPDCYGDCEEDDDDWEDDYCSFCGDTDCYGECNDDYV